MGELPESGGDGLADLGAGVFLDEMDAGHGHLGQVRQDSWTGPAKMLPGSALTNSFGSEDLVLGLELLVTLDRPARG